ncbi:MAG: glutamate-5-semialdehyde dehydrogenase [Bacillota bacterium]|jgi:glutamate-5-semialdehyde dehydrogenase
MEELTTARTAKVRDMAQRARAASHFLASAATEDKNAAILGMADSLECAADAIFRANREDVEDAKSKGLSEPMLRRLTLSPLKLEAMARGLRQVAGLKDPVGRVLESFTRPNGLLINKVSVPFGVIGVIYESRPDVTADAASLCFKSGNAVILRGGSESMRTNEAIVQALHRALEREGFPKDSVQYLGERGRGGVQAMLKARGLIDLLIPRGGAGLIRTIVDNASVPAIETGTGNCHVYVHKDADPAIALSVVVNAKCQNPAVCNAAETLLVDRQIAGQFLGSVCAELLEAGVELRGCKEARTLVPGLKPASDADWDTEYLSMTLAVKVVGGLEEAISHIAVHGTGHSEAIITTDPDAAKRFQTGVDAACVYVNASTRFTDGGEFGFGAEIGISTQKLHARGPMGLAELTTHKYLISGSGQTR